MAEDNKLAPGVTMTKPTSQLDLERRLEEDFLPESARRDNTKDDVLNPEKVNAPYALEGNDTSAYRGVSAEYMTYANDTEKPLEATEGPEAESLKRLSTGVAGVRKTVGPDTTLVTEVGVGGTETINTATSGEGYSAKLVDAPKDYQGGPPVVGLPEDQATTSTPQTQGTAVVADRAPSAPTTPTKSTAAKASGK